MIRIEIVQLFNVGIKIKIRFFMMVQFDFQNIFGEIIGIAFF